MKALKNLLIFVVGVGVGSVVTYHYTKDKYEKQNNEEQEALLEHYGISRTMEAEEAHAKAERNLNKPDIMEYKRVINETQYNNYSKSEKKSKEEVKEPDTVEEEVVTEIITLEDAGMGCNYQVVTLELYTDGIIADEDDKEAINKHDYFGNLDLDEIFDESEYGDCVYIRNHNLKLDIELAKVDRSYTESIESLYGED